MAQVGTRFGHSGDTTGQTLADDSMIDASWCVIQEEKGENMSDQPFEGQRQGAFALDQSSVRSEDVEGLKQAASNIKVPTVSLDLKGRTSMMPVSDVDALRNGCRKANGLIARGMDTRRHLFSVSREPKRSAASG